MRKSLFRLILIGLLGFVLIIFFSRNIIRKYWLGVLGNVGTNVDNFLYEMSPDRSKPISTLEKETRLATLFGEPFNGFNVNDWQKFWAIIYNVYSQQTEPGKVAKKRQLNKDEIELKLTEEYPMPFSYFAEQHWKEFWKIIK